MQLNGITEVLRGTTSYRELFARLESSTTQQTIPILRAARPLLIGAIASDWSGPVIVLTSSIKRAYNLSEQLPVWIQDRTVFNYAEPTNQFYERVPWVESVIRSRLATLAALMDDHAEQPPLVIASTRALMQRTIPVNQFRSQTQTLAPGQRHRIDQLVAGWLGMGYEPTPIVVEPGTFSRRGGVIDVFPIAATSPVRLDFFDDEIDTLRQFDPATQRSEGHIKQAIITPAREALPALTSQIATHLKPWFATLPPAQDDMTTPITDLDALENGVLFPHIEHYLPYMYAQPISLLDYAPANALVIIEELMLFQDRVEELTEQAEATRSDAGLPDDYPQPYIDWKTLETDLQSRQSMVLQIPGTITEDDSQQANETFGKLFTPGGRFGGQLRAVVTEMRTRRQQQETIVIVTQQSARIKHLWHEQDAAEFLPSETDITTPPEPGSIVFLDGALSEGWSLDSGNQLHLVTDAEIFGWSRPEPRRRVTRKPARPPESDFSDWLEGDYVVHVDYGIGQFAGMRYRTVDGNEREYLTVQYGGNDMLFVPIHQADRLTRYIGADDSTPSLNRLGKPDWARVKSRTQKAVEEEARELLELYATRAQVKGHAFAADNHWQHELEAAFPYIETEDQLRAVREVKADMESLNPMDRLICGDVGYGKTEVALRAAFKAVMDGKQVAILVPTTVLAQQHYETFSNRLEPFPVVVEVMSRFRSQQQLNQMMPRLASGEVDIIIGTHRLLSQDVTINNLGLVIIDEEQRFGVKQKEHFKQLRTQVDVLTLTATPIPRTLFMSLVSVRDISMIQTPPEERLPVSTHVGHFDDKLVRQAVLREIERGGQVFIVHNRVRSIESLRAKLETIVPEARITVAHGQMNERLLEKVMSDFAHGEFDILLSTAIIESGIDIPNANTLIVDRADWFGIAQLYQLRGRVGRSAQQAYAYFFHPRHQTEDSRQRLETLAENTSLGAGFQIAMRDLEMRGAGDILSTKQTGHVAAVGLQLYTQLLNQAIKTLKGEAPGAAPAAAPGIVIDLPLPAYIPQDWIQEIALRLQIYRRIGSLNSPEQVEELRSELKDRFGQLPHAVEGLLYQIEVKLLAQQANATHVLILDDVVQVKLPYLGEVDRPALALSLGDDVSVSRTAVSFPLDTEVAAWQPRLLNMLQALAEGIRTETEFGI